MLPIMHLVATWTAALSTAAGCSGSRTIVPRTTPPRCCSSAASSADFEALSLLSLPSKPMPELGPEDVVRALCVGLQNADKPTANAFERLFEFSTFECRASLTTRKGKSDVSRFIEHAELWSLPGCVSFALSADEPTIIPGTQTRGALAVIAVEVTEQVGFRFKSGHERTDRGDAEMATEQYLFTLSQQRRPPLTGCWLVQSLMPCREHMLFNGDTGADNTA